MSKNDTPLTEDGLRKDKRILIPAKQVAGMCIVNVYIKNNTRR